MASETLTDYERRRLDNIRRNGEMMASLMLQRKAADLSAAVKRPKTPNAVSDRKRSRLSFPSPVVIRRSLRARGLPPDECTHPLPSSDHPQSPPSPSDSPLPPAWERNCLHISDVFDGGPDSSDRRLKDAILGASGEPIPNLRKGGGQFDPRSSLVLRPENVAKVLFERIMAIRFLPLGDRTVIAAGDKVGHVGFWDVDCGEGNEDRVYVYTPHARPVSGISVHPLSTTKIFTSSYDGLIRLMDIKKETFNVIYSSDNSIFSICQQPTDNNALYLGEGPGVLKIWDERTGKVSSHWVLHEDRINMVDFHPQNSNLIATGSTDGVACIWDVRNIKKGRPESLKTVQHHRAVQSAYFSPSGRSLATTSLDNRVGISSGVNFDDLSTVRHDNKTGRWLPSFRAIWGWDDSFLYLGNMKRAIDVIANADKTTTPLESEHMTAIPCRFAAHPHKQGFLAGATASGKIYLWTKLEE